MLINRSPWAATGRVLPVLADGRTPLDALEGDPPPAPCTDCTRCRGCVVPRETEDDQ